MKVYSRGEVVSTSLKYFKGDELAANTFLKYALKNKAGNYYENNPDQMHHRLAKEFARMEAKFSGNRELSQEQIYEYLKGFKYIVPQGSPMSGIGNDHVHMSLSNCIVVDSPKDTMSAIVDSGKELANLFKRRCGVGLDISTLRPEGSSVSNAAGTSSGAWSFADFYSYITRMVGQNNRRGALMISIDVAHPDIEKFITMKHDLTKVTGANVSVRISDAFMHAVKNDEDFTLKFPVDSDAPRFSRVVKAKQIWDLIIDSATKTAEPGILMWDNILKYLPAESYASKGFKTISTNPCAEIPLSAYDSCRLISVNLKHFVLDPFTENAKFDWDKFNEVVVVAQRLSDDLIELELEKLEELIEVADTEDEKALFQKLYNACCMGRRTGLGTHGLADALARMNVAYDSSDALKVIEKIYEEFKLTAYGESCCLARERGKFPAFDWELEKNNLFISALPEWLKNDMKNFGRRNIALLTNAPTGSVSIVSQTSSGIEPVFMNGYVRRKKKNHDEKSDEKDFVDGMGDRWTEFEVFHHNVKEWKDLNSDQPLPSFFVTSDKIDWQQRVKVQAVIQQHIDHAISSTINLPKGTPKSVVGELYLKGWEQGLKGITVYVDGSRSGVLVAKEDKNSKEHDFKDAAKRPTDVDCDIHSVNIKGEKWVILVGMMKGKPYEVFGGLSDNIEIPKKYTKGVIKKITYNKTKPNRYDLHFDGFVVKDIVKIFNDPNYQVLTRMVSLGLRHGAKSSFLVEQLQKDPDHDMTSFSRVLARVLKKYIEDGTKVTSDKACTECKSDSLVYQDGCAKCMSCGYSKCN
jgi:ribonucleoside-diphosphate reductase alpha chain